MKASLVVVGSGIKFFSHLTIEAKAHIEQADKVLYLVNEPAIKKWIQKANPQSESLENFYKNHDLRLETYTAISNFILSQLNHDRYVCVVLYGHPTVFAKPALDAVIKAKQKGIFAKVLPGISAEACLFADLLIDPGSCGCLSLEATDLLIHRKKIDNSCHLIIWQISVIGALHCPNIYDVTKGAKLLLKYLKSYYSLDHQVTLYSAAQYPGFEPEIKQFPLFQLPAIQPSRIATLYIPPIRKVQADKKMLQSLEIKISS